MIRILSLSAVLAAVLLMLPTAGAFADDAVDAIDMCLGPYGRDPAAEDPRGCIGRVAQPCLDAPDGATTLGMTQCVGKETKAWDAILNRDYRALMGRLDAAQQEKLKEAQRAWLTLRDADCAFPQEFVRGSLSRVMAAECFRDHTAGRVLTLRGYIDFMEW